jgi:fumarate hydratase, class II
MREVRVPKSAYYGAQIQRAVENFPISGVVFPPIFIHVLGLVKYAAAVANEALGLLDSPIVGAIRDAAKEVVAGNTITSLLSTSFKPDQRLPPT